MNIDPELDRLDEARRVAEQRLDDLRRHPDHAEQATVFWAENEFYDAEEAYDKYMESLK
jgi:hypothetical protein